MFLKRKFFIDIHVGFDATGGVHTLDKMPTVAVTKGAPFVPPCVAAYQTGRGCMMLFRK